VKKKPADWLLILVRSRGNWQNERAKQSDNVVVKGVGGEGGVRCEKAKTGKKSLCSGLV